MWTFSQSTGQLHDSKGELVATGFSGHDLGFDNPAEEEMHDLGPLPRGLYRMAAWFDKHPVVGLCAIELAPDPKNQMFGRSGFFIHGASALNPKESSHGCPVIGTCDTRRALWASPDHDFQVVA